MHVRGALAHAGPASVASAHTWDAPWEQSLPGGLRQLARRAPPGPITPHSCRAQSLDPPCGVPPRRQSRDLGPGTLTPGPPLSGCTPVASG